MSSVELNGTAIGHAGRADPDYGMTVKFCIAAMILALAAVISIWAAAPADLIYDAEQGVWTVPSGRAPSAAILGAYPDSLQVPMKANSIPVQQ